MEKHPIQATSQAFLKSWREAAGLTGHVGINFSKNFGKETTEKNEYNFDRDGVIKSSKHSKKTSKRR